MNDKVCVIIVNWNGWQDTIECLESVFKINYDNLKVIVCDNNSDNQSIEYIKDWAEGRILCETQSKNKKIRDLIFPQVPKPLKYVLYDRRQAEDGGSVADSDKELIIIKNGDNLGFAGGNNVGLRYAVLRRDFDYVWLLNNDTVVDRHALLHLMEKMRENERIGICGSTVLFYYNPNVVQVTGGGSYNKWLGTPRNLGTYQLFDHAIDEQLIASKMSYVYGASMLVSKTFIINVGLMNEEYFLFFEELDWALRCKGGYLLDYASNSLVYHKEGRSIGTSSDKMKVSLFADFYTIRNRIKFTKAYFPYCLPGVYFGLFVALFNRIIRGQFSNVKMILNCIRNY